MQQENPTPAEAGSGLNGPAAVEYAAAVDRYAGELLKEAGRLEATSKSTAGDPEITSTMVKDADILLRRGYARPRKKPLAILTQVVATVGGFLTGLFANPDKLKDPTTLVWFVVILTVTIVATVVNVMRD